MSDPQSRPHPSTIDTGEGTLPGTPSSRVLELAMLRDEAEKAIAELGPIEPEVLLQAGVELREVLRILALVAEVHRLDQILPAAHALADRIHETRLDRAHQIAHLLAEIALQAKHRNEHAPKSAEISCPRTKRTPRGLAADEAPLSANL